VSFFQTADPYPAGSSTTPPVAPPSTEDGVISAGRDYFLDQDGHIWPFKSVTMFLLFQRWLRGENIDTQLRWCQSLGATQLRVLGMVAWAGYKFGPGLTPNWWDQLLPFIQYVGGWKLRVEFTVFADAQVLMPDAGDQRAHLERVLDTIGGEWNVFIEVCNEPFKNGCDPTAIFSEDAHRPCPMAYGMYDIEAYQDPVDGIWRGALPALDYLTAHTPRDPDSWSRKAKDLAEYRDGSGNGEGENSPLFAGLHIPCVGDEPMGAAEADDLAGRQRSNIANDFFWYVANAAINGAGSTFHCDAGLLGLAPPPGGDQQKCAEASALAWSSISPEYQRGHYTRSGLPDLPIVFEEHYFPEQTSRIYGRILGDRAVCVAIKPNAGWVPKASPGWVIAETIGPMGSLVLLVRDDKKRGRK
jgi:hypothetical protein